MNTPIVLLCGQAGSGKDTVAEILVKNHGAVAIAQADPMKRLGHWVFKFSAHQLWGPSEARNAIDTRFANKDNIYHYLFLLDNNRFVEELLPDYSEAKIKDAKAELRSWATNLLHDAVEEGGLSPRKMLQTLGTEWGRSIEKDMWTNYTKRSAFKLLGGGYSYNKIQGLLCDDSRNSNLVVITDGRFRNEIISVTSVGGEAWKIVNPAATESPGIKGHVSEDEQKSIPDYFYNAVIRNDKKEGLEILNTLVNYVFEERVNYRHPYWCGYGQYENRVLSWGPSRSYEVAVANYNQMTLMQARSTT